MFEKRQGTTEDMKENYNNEVAAFSSIMLQRVMQKFQEGLRNYVTKLDAVRDAKFKKIILYLKCFDIKNNLVINAHRNMA